MPKIILKQLNIKYTSITPISCPLSHLDFYPSYFISIPNGSDLVLKFEKDPQQIPDMTREALILKHLYQHHIPVPQVIHHDKNYILMTRLTGKTLFEIGNNFQYNSSALDQNMFTTIGHTLAKIHALALPDFLITEDNNSKLQKNLQEILYQRLSDPVLLEHLDHNTLDKITKLSTKLLKSFPNTTLKKLCQVDVFPSNFLIKNKQLTGIIDFGRARVIHPFIDLISIYEFRFDGYQPQYKKAFLDGYARLDPLGLIQKLNPQNFLAHRIFRTIGAIVYSAHHHDNNYLNTNLNLLKKTLKELQI